MNMRARWVALCVGMAVWNAGAATLVVPDPYKTVGEAIAAAKAGDTVSLRPGTYREFVSFKDGITLLADPPGSATLEQPAGTTSILVAGTCKSGAIRGITFLQTGGLQLKTDLSTRAPAVKIVNSSLSITDCLIAGSGGDGLHLEGDNKTSVEGCRVEASCGDGIFVVGAEPMLHGNLVAGNRNTGIHFMRGAAGRAEGNVCRGNSYYGICAESAGSAPWIVGNTCEKNGRSGIIFNRGAGGRAAGNRCGSNGTFGIYVDGSAPEIVENRCGGNVDGMGLARGARAVVKANRLEGSRYGIQIADATTAVVLEGNESCGHRIGVLVEKGASASISGGHITDCSESGLRITDAGTRVRLVGVEVDHHATHGIAVRVGAEAEITGCTASDNRGCGIGIAYLSAHAKVVDCLCRGNGENGVYVGYGGRAEVAGTRLLENGWAGLHAYGLRTELVAKGNTCARNGRVGLLYSNGARGRAEGNLLEGNKQRDLKILNQGTEVELADNRLGGDPATRLEKDFTKPAREIIAEPMVVAFFLAEDWKELERLAGALREDLRMVPSRNEQLEVFYRGCYEEGPRPDAAYQQKYLAGLARWRAAEPGSFTPLLALARTRTRMGWEWRGNSIAANVTRTGWQGFEEHLTAARRCLEQAKAAAEVDPEWYAIMLSVLLGLEPNGREAETVFRRGVAAFPQFYRIYDRRMVMLLPRWGGQRGQVEEMANQAALGTRAMLGEAMYAWIADGVCMYVGPAEFVSQHRFDYARIRQGWEDDDKALPGRTRPLHKECFYACLFKDQATARELFPRLGDTFDPAIWAGPDLEPAWRAWAVQSATYPDLGLAKRKRSR